MIHVEIRNGAIVKCGSYGREWFIDGEKVPGNWDENWREATSSGYTTDSGKPTISGKGEWAITAVELET